MSLISTVVADMIILKFVFKICIHSLWMKFLAAVVEKFYFKNGGRGRIPKIAAIVEKFYFKKWGCGRFSKKIFTQKPALK